MMKYRLMVPGPTPIPPEVAAAATLPIEDERTVEYAAVFTRTINGLQRALLTDNELLLFTSSMTGAFEGTIQNLFSPGDRVLIVNNGAFGQRWVELARAFGLAVLEVADDWGAPVDMSRVAYAVDTNPDLVAAIAVHCETSTGVVNDIRAFGAATGSLVSLVDSASGAGACELRTDEWGIDVVVAGCQKALMTPPGLAFASISQRAWRLHERAGLPRFYFDWDAARDALRAEVPRTPWTPAISLISQLDLALQRLHGEGMDNVFRRHVELGRIARAGVLGMGLGLLSPADDRNASVTAAVLPPDVDGQQLVDHLLARYRIQVAGGQGPLSGRVIRIGHCGHIDAFDVLTALNAVELGLRDFGQPVLPGAAATAALSVLDGLRGGTEPPPIPLTPWTVSSPYTSVGEAMS
ncbi:MAG TPA: alanine--glyoxylate aminotransferase family protein [Candidatus Limnocylindrales bacterium]|nr:alanine--glyoxylate aminotransferase family protein [Candidatus Limnocylindrales bacterium]